MPATIWTACSPGPAMPGPASPSTTSATPTRPSPIAARARRPRSPPLAACSSSSCASSSEADMKSPVPNGRGFFCRRRERLKLELRYGVIVAQLAPNEGVEGDGIARLTGYIRIDVVSQARRKQQDLVLRWRHRGNGRVVDIALVGRRSQVDLLVAGLAHEGHGRRRLRQLAI